MDSKGCFLSKLMVIERQKLLKENDKKVLKCLPDVFPSLIPLLYYNSITLQTQYLKDRLA